MEQDVIKPRGTFTVKDDLGDFLNQFKLIADKYAWTSWPELRGMPIAEILWHNPLSPVTAVLFEKKGLFCSAGKALVAAFQLGINDDTAQDLVAASDSLWEKPGLRAELEKICFARRRCSLSNSTAN